MESNSRSRRKTRTLRKNINRTIQRQKRNEAATKIQATTRRNLVMNSMKPTTKATKLIESYVKSKNIYKKKQNEQKIRLQLGNLICNEKINITSTKKIIEKIELDEDKIGLSLDSKFESIKFLECQISKLDFSKFVNKYNISNCDFINCIFHLDIFNTGREDNKFNFENVLFANVDLRNTTQNFNRRYSNKMILSRLVRYNKKIYPLKDETKICFYKASPYNQELDPGFMHEITFAYCDFRNSIFTSCNFENITFEKCFFLHTEFIQCNFHNCSIDGYFGSVCFDNCFFIDCDFGKNGLVNHLYLEDKISLFDYKDKNSKFNMIKDISHRFKIDNGVKIPKYGRNDPYEGMEDKEIKILFKRCRFYGEENDESGSDEKIKSKFFNQHEKDNYLLDFVHILNCNFYDIKFDRLILTTNLFFENNTFTRCNFILCDIGCDTFFNDKFYECNFSNSIFTPNVKQRYNVGINSYEYLSNTGEPIIFYQALEKCELINCIFNFTRFVNIAFIENNILKSTFACCDLQRVMFDACNLTETDFSARLAVDPNGEQNLLPVVFPNNYQIFLNTIIKSCNFTQAIGFTQFDFSNKDLTAVNFTGVELTASNFSNCKITGTIFHLATLDTADFAGVKGFNEHTDFTNIIGLPINIPDGLRINETILMANETHARAAFFISNLDKIYQFVNEFIKQYQNIKIPEETHFDKIFFDKISHNISDFLIKIKTNKEKSIIDYQHIIRWFDKHKVQSSGDADTFESQIFYTKILKFYELFNWRHSKYGESINSMIYNRTIRSIVIDKDAIKAFLIYMLTDLLEDIKYVNQSVKHTFDVEKINEISKSLDYFITKELAVTESASLVDWASRKIDNSEYYWFNAIAISFLFLSTQPVFYRYFFLDLYFQDIFNAHGKGLPSCVRGMVERLITIHSQTCEVINNTLEMYKKFEDLPSELQHKFFDLDFKLYKTEIKYQYNKFLNLLNPGHSYPESQEDEIYDPFVETNFDKVRQQWLDFIRDDQTKNYHLYSSVDKIFQTYQIFVRDNQYSDLLEDLEKNRLKFPDKVAIIENKLDELIKKDFDIIKAAIEFESDDHDEAVKIYLANLAPPDDDEMKEYWEKLNSQQGGNRSKTRRNESVKSRSRKSRRNQTKTSKKMYDRIKKQFEKVLFKSKVDLNNLVVDIIKKKTDAVQRIDFVDQSTLIDIYRIRLIEFMKRI